MFCLDFLLTYLSNTSYQTILLRDEAYDVTVTSRKEMDTINELLWVDLVWFDTIQKG